MIKTDVCIVGAGPAGSIAALFMAKNGINCALVDKARFPRDKICGDGISGWVVTILKELDINLLTRLSKQDFVLPSYGMRIVAPNHNKLDIPFFDNNAGTPGIPPGFICRRLDFDNFLIEEVRKKKEISFFEETEIVNYKREKQGVLLEAKNGDLLSARMVIFANGANSAFSKDPGGIKKTKRFTMLGLKAYYRGISGFHEQNFVELHFLKDFLPGYLWIFPLSGGLANVGVGLDQQRITEKQMNLREKMLEAIETVPYLKERFKYAEMVTKIQAYSLPIWDKRRKISGERFMLVGDAASLIDPVTGEGIGHAAVSGMLAAEQVKRSLEANNFTDDFMFQYDQNLYNKIGKELTISRKIPGFIRYPWLFNAMINKGLKSKTLQEKLMLAITDLETRKRLKEPTLYLKILFGK